MRWRALIAGGAFVACPMAVFGCSLVASLDGLSGNEPDAAEVVVREDAAPGLDGGAGDSSAAADTHVVDAFVADTTTAAMDSGVLDSPSVEAEASPIDAPGDVVSEPTQLPPIAFIQIAAASPPGTVAAVTATLAQAQKAGDLDVVAVGWNDTTSTISQVVDTAGNTYALAVGPTRLGADLSQAIYYAKDIRASAAGANSVVVTFVQPANVVDLRVAEYSGLDLAAPLDKTATGTGTSVGPAATAAVSTTVARELLFAAGMSTDLYSAAGAGFAMRLVTSDGDVVEDRTVSATGSYAATAPVGVSCEWVLQLATFH